MIKMRFPTNIQTKDVKQFTIDRFDGVDFSSSPIQVSKSRGIDDTVNFWKKDGITQKRPGWKQIAAFGSSQINGMYCYEENYYLVYAGTTFYTLQLTTTGIGYIVSEVDDSYITPLNLKDRRVQFFKQDDRIFIVGAGDFLVWHKIGSPATWTLEEVFENDITYIPTTTISIDYDGYAGTTLQATLERPNLFTKWRYNTARGAVGSNIESPILDRVYQLDSTNTYVGESEAKYDNGADSLPVAYVDIQYLSSGGILTTIHLLAYFHYVGTPGVTEYAYLVTVYGGTVYGSLSSDGVLTLKDVITEPPTADDNITVKFMVWDENVTMMSATRAAQFGLMFGVEGVTTQLFMGGLSSTYANKDYYSYPLDFTYFPDNFTKTVGNSAITGYQRLGDGTMVIFKEKAQGEASVFYRTGVLSVTETDGYKDATIVYTERAGFSANYLASRGSIENLAGDSLFLTDQGVKGIVLSENVATDERFARERSYFIDTKLKTYTLTDAQAIVFDNRYYLSVSEVCFVADARYRVTQSKDMDDTFQYEWYFWNNIGARVWYEYGGELYFGTSDGRICKFDTEYTDRTLREIASGGLSIHPADDNVVYDNSTFTLAEGDTIRFNNGNLYEVVFTQANMDSFTGNTFSVKAGNANMLFLTDGRKLTLVGDKDEADEQTVYTANVDIGTMTFDIVDELGNAVAISTYVTSNFYLLDTLSNADLYIVDVVDTAFELKRYLSGGKIPFLIYNSTTIDDTTETPVAAVVTTATPVEADWLTPYLDLGTRVYSKTLLSFTVTTDPSFKGDVIFSYFTQRASDFVQTYGSRGFSFEDFDFTDFSFTVGFMTSYTRKVKVRDFNYILLKFSSETSDGCALTTIDLTYKINRANRGVK